MAAYYFRYAGAAGAQVSWPKPRQYSDLRAALAAARRAARAVIRMRREQTRQRTGGRFEVEDGHHRLVARILLSEIDQQIS
jgi:hypothetical protein